MTRGSDKTILGIYDLLHSAFGPQHWWPARTRDEIVIGAILAQNTAWANVERAIEALREAKCLTLERLDRMPTARLASLIRPSGTYRIKAQRLKGLTRWLQTRFGGRLDALFALGTQAARGELLGVKGIGPETADAIVLYAGKLPTFVVDAYTQRMMRRHLLIGPDSDYARTQAVFERALRPDAQLFGEYHALLVELGKRHCRARARCEDCPLAGLAHDADL